MLVLSRKVGESILIGNDIRVTFNRVAGNRVTVGVEAPQHVRIVRGELETTPRESAGGLVTAPLVSSSVGSYTPGPLASRFPK